MLIHTIKLGPWKIRRGGRRRLRGSRRGLNELLVHGKVETGVVGGHDVVDAQAERLDAEQGAVVGDEQQAVETGQATVPWKMKT